MAISQYPAASWESYRRKRNCLPEIAPQGHFLALRAQGATAPLGPRNDKSGGVCHFDGGLYGLQVHRREGHAPPLQWRVQSPRVPGNLQLPMAVTPRKGDAASVRRQSRQRLRSERRYRRNRFLRFYRHLVRTGSAFPRLPRRFAPRNDNSEVHTILTMACTDRQHCAGHGCPLPYNARPKACVFFILHFSVFRIHFHAPAPLQRISGGPAKNSTLRVSRFLPQIFPFLCITACTGGKTCCGEGQHAWNRSCAVCPTGPTRAR